MGEVIVLSKELEGLKGEMEKLAEHLDSLGATIDADAVGDIIRDLAKGETAETIIDNFDLREDD